MADLRKMFGTKPTNQEKNDAPSAAPDVAGAVDGVGRAVESAPPQAAQVPQKVNPFARAVRPPEQSSPVAAASAAIHLPSAADGSQPQGRPGNAFAARIAKVPSGTERVDQPGSKDSGSTGSGGSPAPGVASGAGVESPRAGDGVASKPTNAGERPNPLQALQSLPSLEALESIDLSDLSEARPMSAFADETPATKPTREIQEDLEPQGKLFVKLIDNIYDPVILHDPELLGSVIRNIMVELQSKPAFMKLVAPEDVRTWVRAMRSSMGLARIKKQEKKAGVRGGSKKSAAVDNDMMSDLDSLVAGLD